MNCEFCKEKLNPFMLKQVGYKQDKLTYEIECSFCRKYNYVGQDFYFAMKRDWEMPKLQPINNKMPSEMNVIIDSMERCGISWIVFRLSRIHEKMFGKPIKFNPEISSIEATRDRFPLPQNWNNVYEVDPKLLLKRNYDRVLIVKRELKYLELVQKIYFAEELGDETKQTILKKMKEAYKILYEQNVNNSRCMTIHLDDLNKTPEDSFNKLMDFFNFPKEGRPEILAYPMPDGERDWEVYSSILKQGQPLCERLNKIAQNYEVTKDGILQSMLNLKNRNKDLITLKNIVIVGPKFTNKSHLSEHLYYAFKEKGYNIELVSLEALGWGTKQFEMYQKHQLAYPLSKLLTYSTNKPDLIIFDEPAIHFINDIDNIPVFYAQREFKRPPKVHYPTIAFFWHQGFIDYFKKMFAPHWAANTNKLMVMYPAIDPTQYKPPKKKTRKGISNLAGREKMMSCVNMNELTAISTLNESIREIQTVIELGLPYVEDPEGGLTDEHFRELLPQCEAVWCHIPTRQFISRRIIEAMACKTVCVIKLENKQHEDILYEMGFQAGQHYVAIKELKELKDLHEGWNPKETKYISDNAYKVVMEQHTFANRVEFLDNLYKDWAMRKKGMFIE